MAATIRNALTNVSTCRKLSNHFQVRSLLQKRFLCSGIDDPQNSNTPGNISGLQDSIPSRYRKRLRAKGLTNIEISGDHSLTASRDVNKVSDTIDSVVEENREVEFPSDLEAMKQHRRQEQYSHRPEGIAPDTTSILLFPGQGSQFVGMGKNLLKYPGVEEIYEKASSILGFDLLNVCINGPENKLTNTLYCQPAVVVTSYAAMEKLKEEYPQALKHVVATAGFSVGEFTALIVSGVLSFEDALKLVRLRAEYMHSASERTPSGMLTVVCSHKTQLRTAMVAARQYCREQLKMEDPVCNVANYLCSNVKVVAGNEEALQFLEQYGREWGVNKTKRLKVSGAFHTDLMKIGGQKFWRLQKALEETELNYPQIPIHLNISGKQFSVSKEIDWQLMFKRFILKQLSSPVMWEQTMHILYTRPPDMPYPNTIEVGPGKTLGTLLKNTNLKAYKSYLNIEV